MNDSPDLQTRVDELETLARLGRQIISSLSIDHVLSAIVDAAVELTNAEEGCLLLVDDSTGELYMRASRNFQEDFVRTFRLPLTDSLAGEVIRTGLPVLLDDRAPQKIKTTYLVRSLIYVPLLKDKHVFGVLGVDNRQNEQLLTEHHVRLMNTLASYAAIALENARMYLEMITERNELDTILTGIHDGVILLDQGLRLRMVNRSAREIFHIDRSENLAGRAFLDVFGQPELADLVKGSNSSISKHIEISLDGPRDYSVEMIPVQGIGQVITLHDITNLKKIGQIKSDFVHTVSHDLRSPLTAILGYTELIERAGPINEMQHNFISRVQLSVNNITNLIDELLELGRIESGLDTHFENIQVSQIIHYSVDGLKKSINDKGLNISISLPQELPLTLANPTQMRQLFDHLLGNAIKYSAYGEMITINAYKEENQIILKICDAGIGIPPEEVQFIFDKFYRASNASVDQSGTGLGLAIVKSIIDNHAGRIWVDSEQGKGTVFTILLPALPM